jgi:hypothetical protein
MAVPGTDIEPPPRLGLGGYHLDSIVVGGVAHAEDELQLLAAHAVVSEREEASDPQGS